MSLDAKIHRVRVCGPQFGDPVGVVLGMAKVWQTPVRRVVLRQPDKAIEVQGPYEGRILDVAGIVNPLFYPEDAYRTFLQDASDVVVCVLSVMRRHSQLNAESCRLMRESLRGAHVITLLNTSVPPRDEGGPTREDVARWTGARGILLETSIGIKGDGDGIKELFEAISKSLEN